MKNMGSNVFMSIKTSKAKPGYGPSSSSTPGPFSVGALLLLDRTRL
jgi:hypothetical protein